MTPQLSAYRHISHHRHTKPAFPLLCQLGELDYVTSESDDSSLTFLLN